jgi:hypothetical protein
MVTYFTPQPCNNIFSPWAVLAWLRLLFLINSVFLYRFIEEKTGEKVDVQYAKARINKIPGPLGLFVNVLDTIWF